MFFLMISLVLFCVKRTDDCSCLNSEQMLIGKLRNYFFCFVDLIFFGISMTSNSEFLRLIDLLFCRKWMRKSEECK